MAREVTFIREVKTRRVGDMLEVRVMRAVGNQKRFAPPVLVPIGLPSAERNALITAYLEGEGLPAPRTAG